MAEIAAPILQLPPFADVAHERVDAGSIRAVRQVQGGRHLDPDRAIVGAAEPQQVIADRPVTAEVGEERVAGSRIDESIRREQPDGVVRLFGANAQHQFQVGIGTEGSAVVRVERPDVYALPDRVVEAAEQIGPRPARPSARARSGPLHGYGDAPRASRLLTRRFREAFPAGRLTQKLARPLRRCLLPPVSCRCRTGTLLRHGRGGRRAGVRRGVLADDRALDIGDRRAESMHLHRVTRDTEAERSGHAVGVPPLHGAIRGA